MTGLLPSLKAKTIPPHPDDSGCPLSLRIVPKFSAVVGIELFCQPSGAFAHRESRRARFSQSRSNRRHATPTDRCRSAVGVGPSRIRNISQLSQKSCNGRSPSVVCPTDASAKVGKGGNSPDHLTDANFSTLAQRKCVTSSNQLLVHIRPVPQHRSHFSNPILPFFLTVFFFAPLQAEHTILLFFLVILPS